MENIEKRNSVRSDNQVSKNVLFEGTANGKPRIMFVGNSITLHRPAPEIGWYGDWGMAASSKDRDYVHLLIKYIKSGHPDAAFCIVQAAAWEREYRSCEIQKVCAGAESFDPDIIITRLSENIPADDIDSELLISSMRNLHEFLSGDNKNVKHIITSNVFNNKLKDALLKEYSVKFGAEYVYLNDYCENKENQALEYEHEGVRLHPGDKGMRFIAERIIPALDKLI